MIKIDKKYITHNTLFIGNRKEIFEELRLESVNYFQDPFGINKKVNIYKIDNLQVKVEDIRNLNSWLNKTIDGVKIVFISSFVWSLEVQNALLKILEETKENTYIYLISQNKYSILPTITSRVFVFNFKQIRAQNEIAKEVLKLNSNERLENKNVKKILSAKVKQINEDDEENIRVDIEIQTEFIENLFDVFSQYFKNLNEEYKEVNIKYIKIFQDIENYTKVEGISLNYFIEFLLLNLPKID